MNSEISNRGTPKETGSFSYDIFLSHNAAQKDWTRDLARRLQEEGFKVWFDEWVLPRFLGWNWLQLLREGVKESRKVALIWSPEFFAKEWPVFESTIIQLMDPAGTKQRVIPLLRVACDIPEDWSFRQALDFTDGEHGSIKFDFRFQQLLYNLDNSRPFEPDFERYRSQSPVSGKAVDVKPSNYDQRLVAPSEDRRVLVGIRFGCTLQQYEQVRSRIEEILKDTLGSISIRHIRNESVVVVIECSESARTKITSLFRDGLFASVLDIRVLEVSEELARRVVAPHRKQIPRRSSSASEALEVRTHVDDSSSDSEGMKAYAILSGGGVKGTALAGCLNAARQAGIEFVGYGGTSAGSIVSVLASIGYQGEELKRIAIDEMPFDQLLDDGGAQLHQVRAQVDILLKEGRGLSAIPLAIQKMGILWGFKRYAKSLGLYEGRLIERFLREKIRARIPRLLERPEITFNNLQENGGKQLKIVATDLRRRAPAIFEAGSSWGSSVIQAVRASTAYPFVFRPVEIEDTRLVDGGLASNVPVFLFRKEQDYTRFPVFAFDVGAANKRPLNRNGLNEFVRDLLTAALETSDSELRRSLPGIEYIKVDLPDQLDALDFKVDRREREALYAAGHVAVTEFLRNYPSLKLFQRADDVKLQLQSRYGPPTLYQPILAAAAKECEDVSGVEDVRATIMLPTLHGGGTRIVAYDYNMEGDSDQALILREYAGCSGAAMRKDSEGVMIADLEESRRNPELWQMSASEAAQIPLDRKSIMSVVIPSWHDVAELANLEKLKKAHRIGVLSVDTTTPLSASRWEEPAIRTEMAERLFNWAKIIARLLAV